MDRSTQRMFLFVSRTLARSSLRHANCFSRETARLKLRKIPRRVEQLTETLIPMEHIGEFNSICNGFCLHY